MKMKMKRFWKLYKELRLLRKKVKILEDDLSQANQSYNRLFAQKTHEVSYSTISILIPNMYSVNSSFCRPYIDDLPRGENVQKRMSDRMKVKLVDDLFEQGFLQKVQDNIDGEIYEIKCINGRGDKIE